MKQLKQIVLTPDDVSELLAKQTKKPRKKALALPKYRFILSKVMFDVLLKFLDV